MITLRMLDHVQRMGIRPRVHGNGFIQLDISPMVRLHVWDHPSIPKQSTNTPIHDHRFAFTSLVLRGEIINRTYRTLAHGSAPPTHQIYHAVPRHEEDTELVKHGSAVALRQDMDEHCQMGEAYFMLAGAIHETIPVTFSVTLMMKHGPNLKSLGYVFVPFGMRPDNEFNRYAHDEQQLWSIIKEAVCL